MKIPRFVWLGHAICLLFLTQLPAFAQPVASASGCVLDSTQAVITRATVILTSSDSQRRFQTRTDGKGCFAFENVAEGSYRLDVLAEDFAPAERAVDLHGAVKVDDIVLDVQPILHNIVVTATRTPTPTMNLGASVDVIGHGQIEASAARNTVDVLRNVAGLSVMRSGDVGGITSLFTRGGESDYTKILVDGIPLNQPGGAYDYSHLATDNIDRIEVVRGAQSALFGSDAITGVVQIITKPGSGQPEFEYSAEGGNFDSTEQSARFQGGLKKFDFSNTFSRRDTDNIGFNNDYRNASYFGNFGYTPDNRQSLRATLMYSSVKAGAPGANAPGFISFGPNNRMSRLERAAGLTYRTFIGSRVSQHLGYRLYDHDQYFYSAFGVSTVLHTRHRIEYHGDVVMPRAGTFSYGVDYDRENATVAADRHFRNNYGYYAQQQFAVGTRFHATAGVRLEDNTTFGKSTTPHLALSYSLIDSSLGHTRLRFNAGAGIKEPSFTENFSKSSFFLGNPALLAEKSKSWEVGVEQSLWSDRVSADVGWFDNRFRNVIELVGRPDGSSQYFNIGRSLARGSELRIKVRERSLSLESNYTYLDGHIRQSDQASFPFRTGDPLLRRPRHSADVSGTWNARRWTGFWSTRYIGKRADSDFFTYSRPLFSNEAYWLSDAALTYHFGRHLSAYLRVNNVFDRSYQEVLGYQALGRGAVAGITIHVRTER